MKKMRWLQFWMGWGLVSRLMLAVGIAIVAGGGVQTVLLLQEGAAEHSARLQREQNESLIFLAPLIADQAILGEYAVISQLLKNQVKKGEIDKLEWTDRDGKTLVAQDKPDTLLAPSWFSSIAAINQTQESLEVTAGGVGYGTLHARMTSIRAQNRLWDQFVKQLQIVAATLFMMLQFIWLIFRGNLGTLRMLAEGANRFSQGDHAVRIEPEGAPEVRLAAEAFNDMANNIESLLESLGKSESKNKLLATIVEQSSEAIWTKDLTGTITSWNSGAAAMFGYPPAEAMGRAIKVGVSSWEEEEAHMKRLVSGERFSYDTKAIAKSGTELDIQVAVAPLVDDTNECIGKIAVARDVTQSKRSEEELRLAREAAETANHAKSSFLARMSHEIRTPMNGVLGMTELLLETELTSTQRKYAETVQRSGKNLLGIINDVLDFSKIEAGKLELEQVDMDLRATVEDIVELLAERAQVKGLEIACNIPADLATHVTGDPLRLGQVLSNLTSNAIKFTERGAVVISVASIAETGKDVTLRFEVSDTGVGISAEAQSRIFDDFSQADGSTTRKHGGSGLGLPISRQLVGMMGGNIHVESKLGVGSTFWFTIRLEKRETQLREHPSAAPTGTLAGVRALIVESSAISRGILHSQISSWGMTNRIVETPEHALELLAHAAARGVPYDVAIIDLGLPGMDTLELGRMIKADPAIASVRLIMLTPVGRHTDISEARKVGIDACLVKPVRQTALYECLVTLLSGSTGAAGAAPVVEAPVNAAPLGTRGNLLLAEDNLINQAVALGVLNLEGYSVMVVSNGREALDAHAKGPFDLILMDCHMPEMDGFEATKKIRERERQGEAKRVPIIALTANAMIQDREECLNAGMDDHLSKPYGRLQMRDMLNRWMSPASTPSTVEEPAPPAQASQLLDRSVLEQLRELQTKDQPDLLARVINLYLIESPKLMQKLKRAAGSGNASEVARTAHSLKSSSAHVGAKALSRLCSDLEASARLAVTEDVGTIFAKVETEHDCVQTALNAELELLAA
jgi:two-component system sensor histidine kinase/response regulator